MYLSPQFRDQFGVSPRSTGYHLEPVGLCDLNSVYPDTGASTVDENRLARLLPQLGNFEESLIRGQAHTDNTGCLVGGEGLWALDDFSWFDRDVLSEGTSPFADVNIGGDETRDLITRGKP